MIEEKREIKTLRDLIDAEGVAKKVLKTKRLARVDMSAELARLAWSLYPALIWSLVLRDVRVMVDAD